MARAYIYFATLPSASCGLFTVTTAGGGIGGAYFQSSDSKIYSGVSTSSLSATGVSVTTSTWYRLDFIYNATANPHTCTVAVNGTSCGQVTTAVAANNLSLLRCGCDETVTADLYWDDVVVSGTSGDYPIGAGYVNHFVPTSDGTHNIASTADFKRGAAGVDILNATTDSYLLIDDIPIAALDAAPPTNDYINAIAPVNATDYTENVFGPAPGISTPTVAPRAVEAVVVTAQAATQTGSFKLDLNDNGTVGLIVEQVGVAGVVNTRFARKHFATPPTGGAWTVSAGAGNFNNLRVRFYSADAAPDQYFVCGMIEAEFATAAAAFIARNPFIVRQAVNRASTY